MTRTRRFRTDACAGRRKGQERQRDRAPPESSACACRSLRLAALHFNSRPLVQKPQAQLRRPCVAKSSPPTTSPRCVPSASCQATPAGPIRVPAESVRHIKSAMRLVPTGPPNAVKESSAPTPASVSAELLEAPPYIPPTINTVESRSRSANCDRPSGSRACPAPHPPVKNPDSRLTAAVSPVTSRWVPAPTPPPGDTLSATPPMATSRLSRATPAPYARGPPSDGCRYQPSM